jgi:hypothetical protein
MPRSDTTEQVIKEGPSKEEIRERAFEIHVERGGIYGYDFDDWLQAERELYERYKNNEKDSKRK